MHLSCLRFPWVDLNCVFFLTRGFVELAPVQPQNTCTIPKDHCPFGCWAIVKLRPKSASEHLGYEVTGGVGLQVLGYRPRNHTKMFWSKGPSPYTLMFRVYSLQSTMMIKLKPTRQNHKSELHLAKEPSSADYRNPPTADAVSSKSVQGAPICSRCARRSGSSKGV